ncbi:hypothetical protein [Anaeromyxobacter oryzae]|uniref:Uncharacterized protein n=1 Tax=Anaeromyxobacter oryzae TaxID=2918170 RepID=A0ABN6N3P0_9BACT|nr:hypothetical protein [Anaeromyxobacter oryzae]BDG06645.1 hypothetical protein AMOR_56410 [Anaeromyxobacter oryzae]
MLRSTGHSAVVRVLAAILAACLPVLGSAEFHCERSVEVNASWCQESVMPSVRQVDASAICLDFQKRLAAKCKPSWDQVKSCDEFSRRFADLLVATCLARGVSEKACEDWGNSFAVGPLTRCERKKVSY